MPRSPPFICRSIAPISARFRPGICQCLCARILLACARRPRPCGICQLRRRRRTGACRFARRGAALLRAGRAAGGAGSGQRLCRQDGRPTATRCSRTRSSAASSACRACRGARRAGAAFARFGRYRRCVGPRGHQQPRDRGRRSGEGLARRQARVRGRDRAQGFALRPRGAAPQGPGREISPRSNSPIPTLCWSATWCSRSAIRSASARP